MKAFFIVLGCGLLGLTGCGGDDSAPAPDPDTVTPTVTATASLTPLPTATPTQTPTVTTTPTITPSATITPTLSTRVIEITAIMPGVRLEGQPTRAPVTATPNIPIPADELPNALDAESLHGWFSFESDHPLLEYDQPWVEMTSYRASRGEYHFSTRPEAIARLTFVGQAFRVRYVSFWDGGIWEIWADGVLVTTIDGYAEQAFFGFTEVFPLTPGTHIVEIRNTGQAHPASANIMVGLDAIDVYQAPPELAVVTTDIASATPLPTFQPAARIEMLQGAPTVQPTPTAEPPTVVNVAIIIAYDENANRAVDLAEGVRGIPVRLMEIGTNRVITQAYSDASGYATLQAVTNSEVRLVVPYFGAYWDVRRTNSQQSFTLLLPAGNQPGLIP